ncbi:hypothetical protein Agabi119p4_8215 [Agaricus bisporus var. burnettii]|uniref:Mitochondrial glyco protein n=1 Tax=Agaricus bisporus var. burnettii TaxID=192524 RepID=A0A8H7EY83_AGABI|nr:hypothetical protein AGABI2DRAFT_194332 [Agaricus bisporus var. bisporus H97]EKV45387.1 hypothetical protein AGABI2DRAFT_194332 [Agaricus bisporus var. bisporus H97]KAF7763678.1 hypothetical protein Agabi119p4_8215 [Agaricus bisporus var. burnettii]
MSAIRAIRQVAVPLVARRTLCTATAVPRVGGMRVASLASSRVIASRGFMSSAKRFGEGSTDVTLSQKLQEELNYEKETGGSLEDVPQFLKDFKSHGVWTIEETPSHDEVTLSRKFGNESLRLIFSTGDVQQAEDEFNEDGEVAENEDDDTGSLYPLRASLTLTKPNVPGCLNLDLMIQDGSFVVDNISYYDDAKVGTELTAEADWKRRGLYIGPQFDTLDVAVQDEFDHFLQERGIDSSLGQFIPQYAEYKEQREYVNWLGKVKSFIDN